MDITRLSTGAMLTGDDIDANANREQVRQRRLRRELYLLAPVLAFLLYRLVTDDPIRPGVPGWLTGNPEIVIALGLICILGAVILIPFLTTGRSPHTVLRAEDSDVRLDDVVGADQTKREAIDSMNLFLASETFEQVMGGKPRRGVLFEGPPGTGKTYLAKAMAAEAGVPFHFVSASEFQSMYYGQTNKKIRTFFKALRKAAREEGGAIGYIEEFDAIGGARSGMNTGSMREGIVGVVNELLVQMQSFDMPSPRDRFKARFVDWVNKHLPPHRRLKRPQSPNANILIVAATNRAADLDPALLRPGRFDRTIGFNLPARTDRVAIARYYLDRKSHASEVTETLVADLSAGYTPVRIEKLLDEALIIALRDGRTAMSMGDVLSAQLVTEVGVAQDMGYHPDERRRIAIHEAGHALTAVLTRRDVKVASILRRSSALGLVAHGDASERYLKTPTEARDLMCVAMAGRAAEVQEYGEASSGISSDLAAATTIASQLVGQLGDGAGLLSLEAAAMPTAANLVAKVLSDERCRDAAESYMTEAAERADLMVDRYRDALHEIADELIERDEVEGERIRAIVARYTDISERRGPVRIKARPAAVAASATDALPQLPGRRVSDDAGA
ncbi:AAA family ATPase [Ilumatobacter sp.]|uniref:AAA family ATPase n=1 Tax=Ilumatobacter sp. TaxID=1967498 RepID=UPI003B517BB0